MASTKHITSINIRRGVKHIKHMSKLCKGSKGIVACLHQSGVKHPRSRIPTTPCKDLIKSNGQKVQTLSFPLPAKYITKTWQETYTKLKRRSKGNQLNWNRFVWTYGCG